jgi:cytochrome P450
MVRTMDLFSPEIRRNPFPVYDQLRATSPILHEPESDSWILFDHASVKLALTDHERFSSSMFSANRSNPDWLIFHDPPRQAKLRALISRAFMPRAPSRAQFNVRL